MALLAKSNGKTYEPLPIGVIQAVCVFVEDIGTHEGSYQGKPILRRQCVVCWEINATMTQGESSGKRFMVSKFYTLSLNDKANLRKDLENWRGKAFTEKELEGFDIEKLIGVNCMLNIVEYKRTDGTSGQKPSAIMPCIKGLPAMVPENTIVPQWIIDKRNESIEAKGQGSTSQPNERQPGDDANDLPF